MGSFSLVAVNINSLIKDLESQNEIVAFVNEDYSQSQAKALQPKIEAVDNVASAEFVSREQAMDTRHNPEFTTVELYEAYGDLYTMMDLFEELLSGAARDILGTYALEWQGERLNLTPGWRRMEENLDDIEAGKRRWQDVLADFYRDFDKELTDAETAMAHVLAGADIACEPTGDWKTELQEFIQQKPGRTLAYELLSESGPDHDKLFQFRVLLDGTEIGRGQGRTKKEAEQSAASAALEALKK